MLWIKQLQIGAAIALLAFTAWGTWKLTSDHYTGIMAKAEAEWQAGVAKAAQDFIDRIVKAEGERNANQTIIDSLSDHIAGMQPAVIRIPSPRRNGQSPCTDQNGESWMALGRINEYTCISRGDRGRITNTYKRCATLNIDAIKMNDSLK